MTPEEFRALIPGDLVKNSNGALGVIVGYQVMTRDLAKKCKTGEAHVIQWVTGGTMWCLATCPCSVPPLVKVDVPACEDCGNWVPPSFSVPQLCPKCHALPPADGKPNLNCDRGQCYRSTGEVRSLPIGADSNAILCEHCFNLEMEFRAERNRKLDPGCRFPIWNWKALPVYGEELLKARES